MRDRVQDVLLVVYHMRSNLETLVKKLPDEGSRAISQTFNIYLKHIEMLAPFTIDFALKSDPHGRHESARSNNQKFGIVFARRVHLHGELDGCITEATRHNRDSSCVVKTA